MDSTAFSVSLQHETSPNTHQPSKVLNSILQALTKHGLGLYLNEFKVGCKFQNGPLLKLIKYYMRKCVSVLLHKILDYSEGQSPNYTMGLWKTSEQGEL